MRPKAAESALMKEHFVCLQPEMKTIQGPWSIGGWRPRWYSPRVMRITRAVRAFFSALKREPGAVGLLLIMLVFVLVIIYVGATSTAPPLPPPETPEQQQARVAAENQREAERKGKKEITRLLCAQKSACSKYAETRQECAVAGNFENCLRVKMGSDDYALKGICTEDGKVGGIADRDIPDPVTCFTSGL